MEPSKQFKSLNIFRKGNVEDDKRLADRATAQRFSDLSAGQTWHEDTVDTQRGRVQGTRGGTTGAGYQESLWNADVAKLQQFGEQGSPLKGEKRPDVIAEGKLRHQRGANSKLKNGETFYRSGDK